MAHLLEKIAHSHMKKYVQVGLEQFQFNYFSRLLLGRRNDLCLNISMTDELSQE